MHAYCCGKSHAELPPFSCDVVVFVYSPSLIFKSLRFRGETQVQARILNLSQFCRDDAAYFNCRLKPPPQNVKRGNKLSAVKHVKIPHCKVLIDAANLAPAQCTSHLDSSIDASALYTQSLDRTPHLPRLPNELSKGIVPIGVEDPVPVSRAGLSSRRVRSVAWPCLCSCVAVDSEEIVLFY